jgi:hypothetical protein
MPNLLSIYGRAALIALGLSALFALAPFAILSTTPDTAESSSAALIYAIGAVTPWVALTTALLVMLLGALTTGFVLRTYFRSQGAQASPWLVVWVQLLAALCVGIGFTAFGVLPAGGVISPVMLGMLQMLTAPLAVLPLIEWPRGTLDRFVGN